MLLLLFAPLGESATRLMDSPKLIFLSFRQLNDVFVVVVVVFQQQRFINFSIANYLSNVVVVVVVV